MKLYFQHYSIKNKLTIAVTLALIVSMSIIIAYSTITLRNALIENSKKGTIAVAEKYSGLVKAKIEAALDAARTSAQTLSTVYEAENSIKLSRKDIVTIGTQLLKRNNEFLGIGFLYKKNGFDNNDQNNIDSIGSNSEGLFAPYIYLNEENKALVEIVNTDEIPAQEAIEKILDPYAYTVGKNVVHMLTAVAPILHDSIHKGNVAIDINLKDLQELITDSEYLGKDSRIAIVSNGGIYAARNTKHELLTKSISQNKSENYPKTDHQLKNIKTGKKVINIYNNRLFVRAPISLGRTNTPWQIRISVPVETITSTAKKSLLIQVLISISLVLLVVIILIFLVNSILKPLNSFIKSIEQISDGKLDTKIEVKRKDEIGFIGKSMQIMISLTYQLI